MTVTQEPLAFPCEDAWLAGIVTRPRASTSRGVLVAVGGPQYRVGSHRQFKLLADYLAERGIPVMRFDYRGMGDSTGAARDFEQVSDDLRAAVDVFFSRIEGLKEVVIWGLCDAASAALLYAYRDARITGLVLLNPWIRSQASKPHTYTYLRHYYVRHLLTLTAWQRLFRGEVDVGAAMSSFANSVRAALQVSAPALGQEEGALPARMAHGFKRFKGPVLLILSGNDLTANEFVDVTKASCEWRSLLTAPRVTKKLLSEATHTFSSRQWRDQVAGWTASWVLSW